MRIELLLHHDHLIPEIAELKFQEFGYLIPKKTLQDFQKGLETHLNDQTFPIAFVALQGNQFVGTFSLRQHDLDTHRSLSPWVGSVLVVPHKRKQGIGSFLVKNAEFIAKEKGYECLYLFTPNKEAWYAKLAWITIEQAFFNGTPIIIMQKSLRLANE
jgi:predicted N-acetyltransferase YhbS